MNIHHLELFYYVARHGGIMEAVRNMPYGIQQPAVSGQILQLESDLGLKLFQRRPFELTAPGRQLYSFIRPFFDQVGQVGERLRGGETQLVRMAAPQVVLREHLPPVLAELRRMFPRLRLNLREAHQPQVESLLDRREIDLAITVLEERPGLGLSAEPLLDLEVGFLVPARSKLTSAGGLLDAVASGADLPPLITLPRNEVVPRRFRDFMAERGLEWPPGVEVSALELIEIYVGGGFGYGLTLRIPKEKPHAGLRFLPIEEIPRVRTGILWNGPLMPVTQALVTALKARAAVVGQRLRAPGGAG